jgi:hypothetical protein
MNININKKYKTPLHVEYAPKVTSGEYSPLDIKLANILCLTPSFIEDVYNARTVSGIEKPTEYPTNPTVQELIIMFVKLKPQRKKLEEHARKIVGKYQLQNNWLLSVKTAITTGTLLIPDSLGPVVFTPAGALLFVEQLAEVSDRELREFLFAKNLLEAYEYPSLHFTRKISVNGLNEWLTKHSDEFEKMQAGLPDKEIRMTKDGVYWGFVAEAFIRSAGKSTGKPDYVGILKRIDELFEYTRDENFPEPPSRTELGNYHKGYLSLLKRYSK